MRRIIFTNNKRLNYNKYTLGSGVGSVNSSNRAALKRRASASCCTRNIVRSGIRYVKVLFRETFGIIQISQLAVYSNGVNIAPNGTVSSKNTFGFGSSENYPNDGILSARGFPFIYHSYEFSEVEEEEFGYWLLDLGQEFVVNQIVYYNRSDSNNDRAIGMLVETYDGTYNNNFPNVSSPLNQFTLNSDLVQTLLLA